MRWRPSGYEIWVRPIRPVCRSEPQGPLVGQSCWSVTTSVGTPCVLIGPHMRGEVGGALTNPLTRNRSRRGVGDIRRPVSARRSRPGVVRAERAIRSPHHERPLCASPGRSVRIRSDGRAERGRRWSDRRQGDQLATALRDGQARLPARSRTPHVRFGSSWPNL